MCIQEPDNYWNIWIHQMSCIEMRITTYIYTETLAHVFMHVNMWTNLLNTMFNQNTKISFANFTLIFKYFLFKTGFMKNVILNKHSGTLNKEEQVSLKKAINSYQKSNVLWYTTFHQKHWLDEPQIKGYSELGRPRFLQIRKSIW